MDTNTLLIIIVVIFLCGGFGFYGRGRWFWRRPRKYRARPGQGVRLRTHQPVCRRSTR